MSNTLVNNVAADLRETVNVGFPGAKIAAFDGVVEQAINAVTIVLVILRRIDSALGGNAVGSPRTVLEAESLYLVAQLGEGGRGRRAGQAAPDYDHLELPTTPLFNLPSHDGLIWPKRPNKGFVDHRYVPTSVKVTV